MNQRARNFKHAQFLIERAGVWKCQESFFFFWKHSLHYTQDESPRNFLLAKASKNLPQPFKSKLSKCLLTKWISSRNKNKFLGLKVLAAFGMKLAKLASKMDFDNG